MKPGRERLERRVVLEQIGPIRPHALVAVRLHLALRVNAKEGRLGSGREEERVPERRQPEASENRRKRAAAACVVHEEVQMANVRIMSGQTQSASERDSTKKRVAATTATECCC